MASKSFCPLPWKHLATHPHGSITLCCESEQIGRQSESFDKNEIIKKFIYYNSVSLYIRVFTFSKE